MNSTVKQNLSKLMQEVSQFAKTAGSGDAFTAAEAAALPGSEKNKSTAVPAPLPGAADPSQVPTNAQPKGEAANASTPVDKAVPGEDPTVAGTKPEVPVAKDPLTKSTLDKSASALAEMATAITARVQQNSAQALAEAEKTAAAKPADAQAAPAADSAKTASPAVLDLTLTQDMLAKIAAIICMTEEGAAYASTKVAEFIGAQDAQAWSAYLASQSAEMDKQAAAEQEAYAAGEQAAAQLLAYAQHPLFKQGQELGLESLQGDMPDDVAAEGAMPDDGGAEDEITPEDLIGALQMLVESGQMQAEDAAALVEQLVGGDEGAVAPADAGAAVPAAAEPAVPPAAAEPAAEPTADEKKASADEFRAQLLAMFQRK